MKKVRGENLDREKEAKEEEERQKEKQKELEASIWGGPLPGSTSLTISISRPFRVSVASKS